MSVMVRSASVSETGLFGFGTFPKLNRRASKTSINVEPVTEQIRMVLMEFDEFKLEDLFDTHVVERPAGYPADEVEAVEFIRGLLRINQDDVLAAVGIAPRTFHGWRQRGHRPRKSSTGALWSATEVLFYLKDAHPNLAGWFHDSAEARELFATGNFTGLADLELDWAVRSYGAPTARVAPPHVEEKLTTEQVRGKRGPALRPAPVDATKLKGHTRRDHD